MPKKYFLIFLSLFVIVLASFVIYSRSSQQPSGRNFKITNLTGDIDPQGTSAYYDGEEIPVPETLLTNSSKNQNVLGSSTAERWIEVDISDQKMKAWEGGSLFLEAPISGGLPWTPTPRGEFRIMYKSRAQKMEGGVGKYYYYLPNVPFIMFFGNDKLSWSKGYSLHGAYWHNEFGTPRSHGCVNLQIPVAERLYYWTSPVVPEGKGFVKADDSNVGTRIVIHE